MGAGRDERNGLMNITSNTHRDPVWRRDPSWRCDIRTYGGRTWAGYSRRTSGMPRTTKGSNGRVKPRRNGE